MDVSYKNLGREILFLLYLLAFNGLRKTNARLVRTGTHEQDEVADGQHFLTH